LGIAGQRSLVELNRTLVDKDERLSRQAPILWCPGESKEKENGSLVSIFFFNTFVCATD
jgi:hypothetical protein